MDRPCIHLVPHTHWDREWYFTSAKSKIYLVNNMAEILDMLEQKPDYPCYVLDGQSVVLEDYLSVCPENKDRVKKLVEEGRLKIGPWYTQTDEMVVGGESIVRNLLYGKIDCEKFGQRMEIGYLPDSFGQSAAMPKILNGFGIEKSLFWRGYSQRLGVNKTEFLWQADDGSKVVVQLLPINYSVGITMPNDSQKLHEQLDEPLQKLVHYTTTGYICIPNGHDQMPIQQNIFEIIKLIKTEFPNFDVKLSSYEDLYEQIDTNSLDTIKGELYDGKYMRVHRSISSSRCDIKTLNTRIENKITNVLEPLVSIACTLGFDYQSGTLEQIWREMLKNHAHDSIGCCCTDEVNLRVKNRFINAEDMVDNLCDFYMRKLIENAPGENKKLIIVNALPYKRSDCFNVEVITLFDNFDLVNCNGDVVDYEIIARDQIIARDENKPKPATYNKFIISLYDEIPAMGYQIYNIVKSANSKNSLIKSCDAHIENEYFAIDINENGSLNIQEKKSGTLYNDVFLFEDSADGGDSYDFSPIKNDWVITSKNVCANIKTNKCSYFENTEISFRFELPKDIEARVEKRIDAYVDVDLKVCLHKNSPIIRFNVDVDNHAKDHRLRVLVPQNITASKSVSDIQFGKLKRDVYDGAMDVWESENWDERPDSIYPFLSYVHVDNQQGLAVLTNSVREFEIVDGQNKYDTIAITLFRSFGFQGRGDLLRRPGRPSGTLTASPDAQLIGKNSYELALTSDIKNVAKLAKFYTCPVDSYSSDPREDLDINHLDTTVPNTYSIFDTDNSDIILTAFKRCENGEGFCARFYNSSESSQKLKFNTKFEISSELMLDESFKAEINGNSEIEFSPFEIKTLLLH